MRQANLTAIGLAVAALGAATTLFAQNMIITSGNSGESGLPLQPQVAQILSSLNSGSPSDALKRQETAEQKLVDMGSLSADLLKRQMGSVRGAARDVLIVAAFRLENAPLSPRQSIGEWATKKAGVDPAAVILQHFSADDLRRLFPHHLFYVVEKKPDASGKNGLGRTLVALAADGKVQPLNDDAALAHFLKVELPETAGKLGQRRAAAAAAELALARQAVPADKIFSDAKLTNAGAIATARSAVANAPSVSVAVAFSYDERVTGVATTVIAPAKQEAPVSDATGPATEAVTTETSIAETAPASRPARHLRHVPPIMRHGPMLRN